MWNFTIMKRNSSRSRSISNQGMEDGSTGRQKILVVVDDSQGGVALGLTAAVGTTVEAGVTLGAARLDIGILRESSFDIDERVSHGKDLGTNKLT